MSEKPVNGWGLLVTGVEVMRFISDRKEMQKRKILQKYWSLSLAKLSSSGPGQPALAR
jgi:hypothetical protein